MTRLLSWWWYHQAKWWITNPRLQWNPFLVFHINERIEQMRSVRDYKGLRNIASLLAVEAKQPQSPLKLKKEQ